MLIHLIGAILDEVPKEGDPLKMIGSAIVCVAASKEEVIEKLRKDIYAESDVWDLSKVVSNPHISSCFYKHAIAISCVFKLTCKQVQIYPYKCAFRYQ